MIFTRRTAFFPVSLAVATIMTITSFPRIALGSILEDFETGYDGGKQAALSIYDSRGRGP